MSAVLDSHRVILRNTRNVKIERNYGNLTHNEIAILIKETHAVDNGLRIVDVWHADGSRCDALSKAGA